MGEINVEIKKLQRDFYLLDNKLLYVSKDFIGFDPLISKGFSYPDKTTRGTTINLDEFGMGGFSFNVILIHFMDYGPLRGYRRAEILRNGTTIINYESGGGAFWAAHWKGNNFHLENDNAFLAVNGYTMRDPSTDKIYADFSGENNYLFWFKNIVIPTKGKAWPTNSNTLEHNRIYSRAEIEPLIQIKWEAHVAFNNYDIHIRKTAVPNCWCTFSSSAEKREEFQRCSNNISALDNIEFVWNRPQESQSDPNGEFVKDEEVSFAQHHKQKVR